MSFFRGHPDASRTSMVNTETDIIKEKDYWGNYSARLNQAAVPIIITMVHGITGMFRTKRGPI